MAGVIARLALSTARSASVLERSQFACAFNSLSQFQRVYIARNHGFITKSLFSARGVATASKAKSKSTTTKRATTKKTGAKAKKSVKKAAPKKKVAKKPKKAAPKKKKVLTDEQKTARAEKAARAKLLAEIEELKKLTLEPPKKKPITFAAVYLSQHKGESANVVDLTKRMKTLSMSEKEALQHEARRNAQENDVLFHDWLGGKTPDEIRIANKARTSLRHRMTKAYPTRKFTKRNPAFSMLKDSRQVKKPLSPYLLFSNERRPDFSGEPVGIIAKAISKEWSELTASEKKKYEDLAAADKHRYQRECESTYNSPPPS